MLMHVCAHCGSAEKAAAAQSLVPVPEAPVVAAAEAEVVSLVGEADGVTTVVATAGEVAGTTVVAVTTAGDWARA